MVQMQQQPQQQQQWGGTTPTSGYPQHSSPAPMSPIQQMGNLSPGHVSPNRMTSPVQNAGLRQAWSGEPRLDASVAQHAPAADDDGAAHQHQGGAPEHAVQQDRTRGSANTRRSRSGGADVPGGQPSQQAPDHEPRYAAAEQHDAADRS